MHRTRLRVALVVVSAVALTATRGTAQQAPRPLLADYFTPITATSIDRGYAPLSVELETAELNGDGH